MRIFYVSVDPGETIEKVYGGVSHGLNVIQAFKKIGIDVITIWEGTKSQRNLKKIYVKVKKFIPFSKEMRDLYRIYYGYESLKLLRRRLQNELPSFIYERNVFHHPSIAYYARSLGVTTILEVNSPLEESKLLSEDSLLRYWADSIERQKMRTVDAIVTVSTPLRSFIVDRYSINANKVFVIPNGVDPALFYPDLQAREGCRNIYGLHGKVVIGFVGKMTAWHGIDLLIEAAPSIIREARDVRFLLVGGGESRDRILALIESKQLSRYFIVTGYIPYENIPSLINAMDICVVSNPNWYASPIKLAEYAAVGKPVVCPDLEAIRDRIDNDLLSYILFRSRDPDSFTETLVKLIKNKSLRRAIGSKFREHILTYHTWQRNAERILEIYKSLRN